MKLRTLAASSALVAFVSAACSSSSSSPGGPGSGADSALAGEAAPLVDSSADEVVTDVGSPSEYPAGPYGTKVGEVMADIDLQGYVHFDAGALANTTDYALTRLSDIRRLATVKYALLHVAEFW